MKNVHRLGSDLVNFYLLDTPDGLILVDAGIPSYHAQVRALIDRLAKPLVAVLLTHAHLDHIGLAARLHREEGADIWVHEADAPLLADPLHPNRYAKPEVSIVRYALRRPAALRTPLHLARGGAFFRTGSVPAPRLLTAGPLDLPGAPIAIPTPGHTDGSVAYHFPSHGVLCTGDALVTEDSIIGRTGPRTVCRGFTHNSAEALASLENLQDSDASTVLPGHGNLFHGPIRTAVAEARKAGIA